jgi:hypothetical protein
MDTPRVLATSFGGTPLASSFLADSILLSVILGLRPPLRQSCLATSSPARVRSTASSLHLGETGHDVKEEAPGRRAGPVSMESVRVLNWTPCLCRSPTRLTSCLTERPSRSSFQTTRVSTSCSISSALTSLAGLHASHSPCLQRPSCIRPWSRLRFQGSDPASRHAHNRSAWLVSRQFTRDQRSHLLPPRDKSILKRSRTS